MSEKRKFHNCTIGIDDMHSTERISCYTEYRSRVPEEAYEFAKAHPGKPVFVEIYYPIGGINGDIGCRLFESNGRSDFREVRYKRCLC
jgi:hypothetical protein